MNSFAKHHDIFEGNIGTCLKKTNLQLMRNSSNDIRRGNMGTHHTCKEQYSIRTNKYGKEYVKHHISGQKKTSE